jgi:beta-lactam-binding protein with PASTA domain
MSVEPGGDVTCDVTVRNTGSIVDGLRVTVEGDAATWASVDPATLRLMPGSEGVATVRFRPPRESSARAGRASFEVRVSSVDNPRTVAVSYGTVEVGEFHEIAVELTPTTSRGARNAVHRFKVDNGGNAPLAVDVMADDPDELLQFTTVPASLLIPPGGSAASRVQVRAKKNLWWGPSRSLPLRVVAKPDGGEPVRADGAFSQLPRFPKWFRKALLWPIALGAVSVIALIGFIASRAPAEPTNVPNCLGTPPLTLAQCTQAIDAAELKFQRSNESSATLREGEIVRTEPPAGTEVKKGFLVTVVVSEGLKVPNDLVGKTEQAARIQLLGLGFTVPTPPLRDPGGQKDVVVRTEPPAGTPLTAGAEVRLVVSEGTTTTMSTTSSTTSTTRPTTTTTTTSTTTTSTTRVTTTVTTRPPSTTTRT